MKKFAKIGVLSGVIALIGYVICNHNQDIIGTLSHKEWKKDEVKDWAELSSIDPDDSCHVIKVIWDQKYGETKKEYCKALFVSEKANQLKLVSPWKTTIILRVNTNDLSYEKVDIDELNN